MLTQLDQDPYYAYGGVRKDAILIGKGGAATMLIVDIPVSLGADTLFLPVGLYNLRLLPPLTDPLKGWESWKEWDEQPTTGFDPVTRTRNKTLPPKHSALDEAMKDDYQKYLKNHEPDYFESDHSFYEDGTGLHAVKIRIGKNGYYRIYIFKYDRNNKRISVIRYADGGYAC